VENKDSRLCLYPSGKILLEPLTSTGRDGKEAKAVLEYYQTEINLGNIKYSLHVGSTAGRKGLPNQDAAGISNGVMKIEGKSWDYIAGIVCDGVSSRENSDVTSIAVASEAMKGLNQQRDFASFERLIDNVWGNICVGASEPKDGRGITTVVFFFLAANGADQVLKILNCGDSRAYWATEKEIYTAAVHNNIFTGGITYSLGNDGRDNLKVRKDVYTVNEPIQKIFLCSDTFAFTTDGVHFADDLIPVYGRAISSLNDHLTSILVRKIS
jgi:hypothetical protein